jgi:hypothetical protein
VQRLEADEAAAEMLVSGRAYQDHGADRADGWPAHAGIQACSNRAVVSRRFAHAITSPVKICPRCR